MPNIVCNIFGVANSMCTNCWIVTDQKNTPTRNYGNYGNMKISAISSVYRMCNKSYDDLL